MSFNDLFEHAFTPVNTGLSILLGLSILYWLVTIISGIGGELGIDFGGHGHADIDGHMDGHFHGPDGTIEVPHEPSMAIQFLKFLNLDVIPITFFLTLVLLFTWAISINLSYYLPMPTWLAFLAVIPTFFAGSFITKYVTWPFRGIFTQINHKGEKAYDFLGREGVIKSTIEHDKMGMIELIINKDPIKLIAKSKDGKLIKEGSKIVILDESADKKFYIVEVFSI
jgi:hypothetical protein